MAIGKSARVYRMREKLFPSLLAALAIPFTLFIFGVIDVFAQNKSEFEFVLSDVIWVNILYFVLFFGVIFGSLMLLDGRKFDIAYGVYTYLAVMFVLQGNYLNQGFSALVGDGTTASIPVWKYIINAAIWLAMLAAFLLAVRFVKRADILRTIFNVMCITVIGMQLITLMVTCITTGGVFESKKDKIKGSYSRLSTDNLTNLGSERNVIYFVVDRFDARYYEKAKATCPEIFSELDGFVYYSDNLSLYSRTYPAVPYMLTGKTTDFKISRADYLYSSYSGSNPVSDLHDAGYSVNIYTDNYAYSSADCMSKYADNIATFTSYHIDDPFYHSSKMTLLSFYRFFPFAGKYLMRNFNTDIFNDEVIYDGSDKTIYDTDNKKVWLTLSDRGAYTEGYKKSFKFIHIDGCHLPNDYSHDFKDIVPPLEALDTNVSLKQSFAIINSYIKELKARGLYKNATIIITGDHPDPIDDTKEVIHTGIPRVTSLFVKRSGDYGGEDAGYTVDSRQVSQSQTWAEIFTSEGFSTLGDGTLYGDIPLSETPRGDRVRRFIFERSEQKEVAILYYEISGTAWDMKNWKNTDKYEYEGSVYQ